TPLDRITLTVDLPWAYNRITEIEGGVEHTSRLSGFSDLIAQITGVVWRNRDVLPSTWVEARAFAKFPTGASSEAVRGVKDPHLQVGTGSYDYGVGKALVHKFDLGAGSAGAPYRVNQDGRLGLQDRDLFLPHVD